MGFVANFILAGCSRFFMDTLLLRQSIRNSAGVNFSRSGGPGGQNVNKVNTKVTLRLRIALLEGLSQAERSRLLETLGSRLSYGKTAFSQGRTESLEVPQQDSELPDDGELVISSSEERSQRINLERAYARAETLVVSAARLPKKRKPSKPSAAAREKRLTAKRLQGEKKAARRISAGTDS
jgi:ribosome-associated protein